MVEKIKIAIAEDHPLMRNAIKDIISQTSFLKILFEVSNGVELLNEIEKNKLQPDIVLIDYFMTLLNGLETTKRLRKTYPMVKILVFSNLDEKNAIKNLFYFGINGFLSKIWSKEILACSCWSVSTTAIHTLGSIRGILKKLFFGQVGVDNWFGQKVALSRQAFFEQVVFDSYMTKKSLISP